MATVTPNFNWPVPTSTDLVKDGATAIEALGDSIDASLVDLKGGTTGQVLSKNSNTDMDFTWVTDAAGDITGVTAGTGISGGGTSGTVTVTNSMATIIDAKGDLVPGTGADTFARLAVGANGTVLTADSAEATGLKWAAPASTEPITFWARPASAQSFTSTVTTKINFGTEVLDSDGCFASSRFTPTKAGYYQIMSNIAISGGGSGIVLPVLYKNGAQEQAVNRFTTSDSTIQSATNLVYLNGSTDYVEVYVYCSRTSPVIEQNDSQGFQGFFVHS
jgi:hypothetical protein